MDIAGAFDRVSYAGVIHKAAQIGLGGKLLQWLTNYLSNRQLKVVIHGQTSTPLAITTGVPQGSILGPTLSLLSGVCDIDQCLTPGTKLSTYADDTTLYHLVLPTDDPANPDTGSRGPSTASTCGENRGASASSHRNRSNW